MKLKAVLTIAGSDSGGGAGIQADIKTMAANRVYGMSVITALTAQNTTGVQGVFPVSPDFVKMQIDSVFTDIRPDAVKIGMLSQGKIIEAIAERLNFYKAENVVVDPVMVSTSGSRLLEESAQKALVDILMPMAEVVTPNIPEAEILSGMKIACSDDMEQAAMKIEQQCGTAVLLKGGHSVSNSSDVLCEKGKLTWFKGRRIDNPNTHGTGCTLSSAIACGLAKGMTLEESINTAKSYLTLALESGLDMGKGSGPLDHCFGLDFSVRQEK